MAETVLLGNGPNRVGGLAVAWDEVLRQMAADEWPYDERAPEDIPLPLLFEELALARERRGKDGLEKLKVRFAEAVGELQPNHLHRKIMSAGPANVITTNYDYCLELAESRTWPERDEDPEAVSETKYSIFRYRASGPTRVWHMHGEAGSPRTLQLGYQHYGSGLSRIDQYLKAGIRGRRSWFARGSESVNQAGTAPSWIDVFLRDDVHIIGLALDFVEVDLWWLLVYKERVRCSGEKQAGTTYYHTMRATEERPNRQRVLDMLRGIGVQIIHSPGVRDDDYDGHYLGAIASVYGD